MTASASKVPTKVMKKDAPTTERVFTLTDLFQFTTKVDVLYMTVGGIGAMITGLSIPSFNILFGEILDQLNDDGSNLQEGVNQVAMIFAIFAVVNFFTGIAQVYCWTVVGERQTQKLREQYVSSILRQEIGWFDTGNASELSTKVADLSGKVQDGVGRKLSDCIQYFFQILGAFVVAFYLSWELSVVLLVCFPVVGAAGYFMISAIGEATTHALAQYAAAGGLATETLNAIRTISSLNLQSHVIERYRQYLVSAMNVGIYKGYRVGLGNGLLFCACFFCYGLAFWYGSILVARDIRNDCTGDTCQTGGSIMACFFSVLMGAIAMGQISPPIGDFSTAMVAAKEMLILCERDPLIDGLSTEGHKPKEQVKGRIEFKNITFCYPARPDTKICEGFNLTVEPGETVAICGASGSGKSTTANLLLRFYDPQEGEVTLDGNDIKTLNSRWLRNQIGYVGQEPYLFSGTIADNISDGIDREIAESFDTNDKLIQDRVEAAAKLANCHDFIMSFPDGYATEVGSNGVSMSGGQKQRIAIARALIKNPHVLLFDEATSALDTASEQLVQESIDALQRDDSRTTIVIAHRLSTIKGADKIALLHGGKIAEFGTHDDLIKDSSSKYAELVRMQMHQGEGDEFEESTDNGENKAQLSIVRVESERSETERVRTSSINIEMDGSTNEAEESSTLHDEKDEWTIAPPDVSKRMWRMVRFHYGWLSVGIFGAMVYGGTFPLWGYILATAQSNFYENDADEVVKGGEVAAIQFVFLGFLCLFSSTLEFWGIAHVGEKISTRIRSDMFESLLHRGISFFDEDKNASGILINRLAEDSRIVNKATGEAVAKQIQAMFTFLIGLVIAFNASWKIALVVLATFPLNIIASAIQMQTVAGTQHDTTTVDESHAAVIASAFTHMRTVSSLSMQFKVSEIYNIQTRKVASRRKKKAWFSSLGFGGSQLSLFSTYALLFWYGAKLITAGEINFEELMIAIMSLMLGAMGLGMAMTDMGDQKEGVMAAYRIFSTIDSAKNDPQDGLSQEGEIPTMPAKGLIEFRNVTFAYPTRKDVKVFKNFNLTIEAGKTVALVGPSGSGKSSVMGLLLRFYDPEDGEILLDGVNIKTLNIRWLRGQFGYVGQEPVLFSGTVAENIQRGRYDPNTSIEVLVPSVDEYLKSQVVNCLGSPPAVKESTVATPATSDAEAEWDKEIDNSSTYQRVSKGNVKDTLDDHGDIEMGRNGVETGSKNTEQVDEDVKRAGMLSHADEFVMGFPSGYGTDVGEGSIMVSGGQKQRIAIARAIVKEPHILLLDEATSALDGASEKLVQESIDSLQSLQTHTSIVIAHRLSTIKSADTIVVVDKGRVIENGNHDELLQLNKMYAKLWHRQQGGRQFGTSESRKMLDTQANSLRILQNQQNSMKMA